MTFQFSKFGRSILLGLMITGLSGGAFAAYPDKPIKLVVPYPPGGATDVIGRILAKNLGESLGQQVVVENRGGAGGNIGAEAVAKASPDGYTLLMGAVTSHSTMATLEKGKLRYDLLKDFSPVMIVGSVPLVVVVNPNVPVRTLKKLGLRDVSIVTHPAYEGTEIGLRSLQDFRTANASKIQHASAINATRMRMKLALAVNN